MLSGILGPASGDTTVLDLFEDSVLMRTALDFEAALAEACAAAGLIEQEKSAAIVNAAEAMDIDKEALTLAAQHAGTLAIPLVEALRESVAQLSAEAAVAVHLGSTSQDVLDTVSAIHCRRAAHELIKRGQGVCNVLADLAEEHIATPMIGRTLLRQAKPITFGLKCANWLSALVDAMQRVCADAGGLNLQFGGAVGTLTDLEEKGSEVVHLLAGKLDLHAPESPWHTNRTRTVALGTSLAITSGALGKIAGDIALLGQDEIGEAFEALAEGRGGSSAMPHKRNPTSAQQILAATGRVPPLTHTLLNGMRQEHERGLAGWQIELPVLAEMFVWTYDAMTLSHRLIEHLEVDTAAMQKNLHAANVGEDFGAASELVSNIINRYRSIKWKI